LKRNQHVLLEENAMALNKRKLNYKSDLEKNKAQTDSLKSEITRKEKEVNTLYETYIAEAEAQRAP
jgi:hypothetical protein